MDNKIPKIFIYSRDADLCNSISMLFQSKYEISYSTNSINHIDSDVELLIIDVPVSDNKLLDTIKELKANKPNIKILLLYIFKIYENETENYYRKYSDDLLYKPIDVMQLTFTVENLIMKKSSNQHQGRNF